MEDGDSYNDSYHFQSYVWRMSYEYMGAMYYDRESLIGDRINLDIVFFRIAIINETYSLEYLIAATSLRMTCSNKFWTYVECPHGLYEILRKHYKYIGSNIFENVGLFE